MLYCIPQAFGFDVQAKLYYLGTTSLVASNLPLILAGARHP
jgi:hypothetical protein